MKPRSGAPIPTRSRLNFSVPSSSMIEPRPLWPPGPPPSRKRSLPNGRAKSSATTSRSTSGACSRARTLRTARPESFMKVSGLTSVRSSPWKRPIAIAAASRVRPLPVPAGPIGEPVEDHPADVVAGLRVLVARVAQADDDLHALSRRRRAPVRRRGSARRRGPIPSREGPHAW